MAVQLAFLAVADLFYRNANLEHAAASSENMLQGAVHIVVFTIYMMLVFSP